MGTMVTSSGDPCERSTGPVPLLDCDTNVLREGYGSENHKVEASKLILYNQHVFRQNANLSNFS